MTTLNPPRLTTESTYRNGPGPTADIRGAHWWLEQDRRRQAELDRLDREHRARCTVAPHAQVSP